jgi:hypothetical protein
VHGGRQLVRLRQGLEGEVEPLHQWRDDDFRPQGGQVLQDDAHLGDPYLAVHAVEDDGLQTMLKPFLLGH